MSVIKPELPPLTDSRVMSYMSLMFISRSLRPGHGVGGRHHPLLLRWRRAGARVSRHRTPLRHGRHAGAGFREPVWGRSSAPPAKGKLSKNPTHTPNWHPSNNDSG